MSPASQGNLEVERYIGSCLISARSNNNNNASKSSASGNANGNHHQHHANYKNKKVDGTSNNSNNNSLRGGRVQSRPLLGCPHHGYAPPGSLMAMCDCARYGSPGHSPPGGGGWTGMPLISMAPANGRRNRKPAPCTGPPQRNHSRPSPPPPPPPPPSSSCSVHIDGDPSLRSPLSRLAIHTQGAPLILSGHYNARKNNNSNNNVAARGPGRPFKGELPGRRYAGAEVPRDMRGGGGSNNTPNSDCLSVASDESSGHSENSLPRIIKPRKRRKKDRKPAASSPTDANNACPEADVSAQLSGILTLKPYVPLCHELYDGHRGAGRRRDDDAGRRAPVQEQHRVQRPDVNVKSAQRPVQDGLHDARQVLANNADVDNAGQNTLFPFPACQPSTCQCRYCDPAGLIWDVDQHCYSPFLTPSSIDLSYPLFLSPPAEAKSFDLFNKDFKDSSSTVADSEAKELVRRSWSEPSASASCSDSEDSRRSLNDFGVIGGGRTCDSGARAARKDAPRHLSTSSESSTHSSLSQNLEVSTEIVTSSLNGHRDIEIKFFSSSTPGVLLDVVGDYSGCESVDWGSADKGQQELWVGSHQVSSVFSAEDRNYRGNLGSSVWGSLPSDENGEETRRFGDKPWPETWQDVVDSTHDSHSKILSEEVDQLRLHHAEE